MRSTFATAKIFVLGLASCFQFQPRSHVPISFHDWEQEVASESKQQGVSPVTQDLLSIIRDKNLQQSDPEQVARAIRQLGARKSIEAVDDLVKLLTFRPPDPSEKYGHVSGSLREPFPAVLALFEIGKPALPSLVKVIEKTESGSTESSY